MSKDEVAKYLTGIGYSATNEDGIVVVWVDQPMPLDEKNKLRKIMQSISYKSSWGWRVNHG